MRLHGRTFMKMGTGETGIVSQHAAPGDSVAILDGCRFPVVLKKAENSSKYRLVGDCYVDGFMPGSSGLSVNLDKQEPDDFVLV